MKVLCALLLYFSVAFSHAARAEEENVPIGYIDERIFRLITIAVDLYKTGDPRTDKLIDKRIYKTFRIHVYNDKPLELIQIYIEPLESNDGIESIFTTVKTLRENECIGPKECYVVVFDLKGTLLRHYVPQ